MTLCNIFVKTFSFWMFAYMTNACEIGIEFTYPEDEDLSWGVLNVFSQLFGAIIIFTVSKTREIFGSEFALAVMNFVLFIGLMITIFTKDVQKRQEASIKNINDSLYQRVTVMEEGQ